MIGVLINGICGRMGRAVYAACQASEGSFNPLCGVDTADGDAELDCPVYADFSNISEPVNVVIDFSVPAAMPPALQFALDRRIPYVIGTTGLSERDHKLLKSAAERIPVFQSGNMSLGVNLQVALTQLATSALSGGFDAEIIEKHHNLKIDAPSGTALMLANAIAAQRADQPEYLYGRHEKNRRRAKAEIGIHSIRGGTIVGEHTVIFAGKDEIVEIAHKAYSKQVFAVGALRAAAYLTDKTDGLYNMQDLVADRGVASHLYTLENQAVITLSDLPADADMPSRIFNIMARHAVPVDMISLSLPGGKYCDIGFSLAQALLSDALDALKPVTRQYPDADIHVRGNMTKLTVEGSGMAQHSGIAARLFAVLAEAGIAIELITTSETKIALAIDSVHAVAAVAKINEQVLGEM